MKGLIKAILRPFWRLLTPLRRKFNARLDQSVRSAVQQSLHQPTTGHSPLASNDEVLLALDNLVTEIYRLQHRVEELTLAMHEKDASPRWDEAGV